VRRLSKDAEPAASPTASSTPARRSPTKLPFNHDDVVGLQRHAGNRAVVGVVAQRRISPEDLAGQMTGTQVAFSRAFTAGTAKFDAGQEVIVVTWSNSSPTVRVRVPTPHIDAGTEADVPKKLVRPTSASVPGIAQYGAGLDKVVKDFESGEQAIAAEKARKGGGRAAVLAQLETLQRNRERLLNKRLIQSSMLNRFDQSIVTWVGHYNNHFGFTKAAGAKKALDPGLVKSMIFQ
jgi:hypothetical protein